EEAKSWFSWGTKEKEKSEATAAVPAKTAPAIGFAGTPVKVILSQARKHQLVVPQEENAQSSRAAVAAAETLPGSDA
ncbi:hypothetical protein, partial [Enterococcus faecium]|uniref:hypothetical protein n=1 Tax=Enterococcus faecium TaxID=1352 RepID=UPI003F41EC46